MQKTIYLSAGHGATDPGVITPYGIERDFNKKIRDAVALELPAQGFKVEIVPDNLTLRQSIDWVNDKVKNIEDGLALEIHCNCCGKEGAETYHYDFNYSSRNIGKKLIDTYCKESGIKNNGTKPDTLSNPGQLGWLRQTKCWAALIECGYLDNKKDVDKLNDSEKIGKAIVKGICAIYDIQYQEKPPQEKPKGRAEVIEEIKKLLDQLK